MQEWRQFLDPNYQVKSIVFRYSIIFNNYTTLIKYGIVFMILFSFIPMVIISIVFLLDLLSSLTYALICLTVEICFSAMLVAIAAITFNTLLRYNNKYYFNKESKLLIICSCLNMTGSASWVIVSRDPIFLAFSLCFALATVPLADWICSILYPVHLIQQEKIKAKNDFTALTILTDSPNQTNRAQEKTNLLVKVLCDPIGFESFMDHLRSEFAAENLLYVVHLIQFQNFLIKYGKHQGIECIFDDNDQKPFILKDWKLPANVPKSRIFDCDDGLAQNQKNTNAIFDVVDVIYKKFVERGHAPLEVNIPSRNRNKITRFYTKMRTQQGDNDLHKIRSIWESLRISGMECWKLMSSSFTRYRLPKSVREP